MKVNDNVKDRSWFVIILFMVLVFAFMFGFGVFFGLGLEFVKLILGRV